MKNQHFLFFLLLFASTLSCTIRKRTVNRGYFVQWHTGPKPAQLPSVVREPLAGTVTPPEDILEIALRDTGAGDVPDALPNPGTHPESASETPLVSLHPALVNLPGPILKTVQFVHKQKHEAQAKPQPKIDPGTARGLYIFRSVWNSFLFGFFLYMAFFAGLLLLFAEAFVPLFVFYLFICLHILVASIYKAVMFMRMARILARVKQSDANALADEESTKKKIMRDRLRINLFFLIVYLVFLIAIII